MKVRLTFTEELLGSSAGDPNIHAEYIASKAPDAKKRDEEVESYDELVKKNMSVFPRENKKPFLWDYQIKGYFKEACSMLSRIRDEDGNRVKDATESSKLSAYRKIIDGTIFVFPRKIILNLPKGGIIGTCQRPLRAQTLQGDRVALACSETVPPETWVQFEIKMLDPHHETAIKEWLDFGEIKGTGQWRNSGKGRFTWTSVK
jgi:hypothetical protein